MVELNSKVYGEALFELAAEEQKVDVLFREAKAVRYILRENTDFKKLMSHPNIPREDKIKVAEKVFMRHVSSELMGFLRLIIEKGRSRALDEILTYFVDKIKEEKSIGVAFVTTAIELDKPLQMKVKKRLLETTAYKEMEMHYTVDTSIIGGMVIRIGDRVIDSSIRSKLNELKKQLLNIQLDETRI